MRRCFRGLVISVGLLSVAIIDGGILWAQEPVEARTPRIELGVGAWFSTGQTQWAHDASVVPILGNPTSKLTYKDVGTNVVEFTGRAWLPRNWFARLNLGFGNVGGGRLTDDDYLRADGGSPSSRTYSDLKGDDMWYLNADLGRRIVEFPRSRGWLDVFAGYQYWYQRFSANGLTQAICTNAGQTVDLDPGTPLTQPLCSPNTSVSSAITVITNTVNWHSIRVGGTGEYRLTPRFSVLGTVALIPVSIIDNKDIHHLRTDLQQDPSISMLGYGIGADADVGARLMLVKNFFLNVGYRVWWNQTLDGTVTIHSVDGPADEFPLSRFQSYRYGLTFGIDYSF